MPHASPRNPPTFEPITQHASYHCRLFASQGAPGPRPKRYVINISGLHVSAHRHVRAKRHHIVGQTHRLCPEIPNGVSVTDPIHDLAQPCGWPILEPWVDRSTKYRRGRPALERAAIRRDPPLIHSCIVVRPEDVLPLRLSYRLVQRVGLAWSCL